MPENQGALSAPDGTLSGKLPRDPRVRRGIKLVLDALLAGVAMSAACAALRQGLPSLPGLAAFTALAMAANIAFKLYSQHYRAVGIRDAWALALGNLAVAAGVLAVCILSGQGWPGGEPAKVVLGASLLLGPLWFGLRMGCRALRWRRAARSSGADLKRTLIVGAGRAGILLCQELQDHPGLGCRVLGFVDDALEKQGVRIQGVPVLGPTALLPLYIGEQQASQVIL